MSTKQLRIKENTLELVNLTKENYVFVNPEFENVKISQDKIVYEVFKNYNKILEELKTKDRITVYKK